MKYLKMLGKAVMLCLLIVLFLMPIGALYYISSAEQAQYETPVVSVGTERGYGEASPVVRMDVFETTTIQAKVISNSAAYMELKAYRYPYRIRWLISPGDAVKQGTVIGYYNGTEIVSELSGVVREINLGDQPFLRFNTLDELVLECYISDQQKSIFQRNGLALSDKNGVNLYIVDMSLIQSELGTRVLLKYDRQDLVFGAAFSNFVLYTGRTYPQTLVVETSCVYKKPGDEAYYVRLLDKDGYFLEERAVEVGYTNEKMICVSGVEEGDLRDSGYKALIEGGSNAGT